MKFKILRNFKKKFIQIIFSKIICINYVEGLDVNKRSDVFWLNQSDIDRKKIFILFEDKKIKNKHLNKKTLNYFLSNLDVETIDFWKFDFGNNYSYNKNFKKSCHNIRNNNKINKFLYSQILVLLEELSIWCNFFNKTNTNLF